MFSGFRRWSTIQQAGVCLLRLVAHLRHHDAAIVRIWEHVRPSHRSLGRDFFFVETPRREEVDGPDGTIRISLRAVCMLHLHANPANCRIHGMPPHSPWILDTLCCIVRIKISLFR